MTKSELDKLLKTQKLILDKITYLYQEVAYQREDIDKLDKNIEQLAVIGQKILSYYKKITDFQTKYFD